MQSYKSSWKLSGELDIAHHYPWTLQRKDFIEKNKNSNRALQLILHFRHWVIWEDNNTKMLILLGLLDYWDSEKYSRTSY